MTRGGEHREGEKRQVFNPYTLASNYYWKVMEAIRVVKDEGSRGEDAGEDGSGDKGWNGDEGEGDKGEEDKEWV